MSDVRYDPKMIVGNNEVMYVRVRGQLFPIDKVDFVQIDPNNFNIVQDIPLSQAINKLMWHNLHDYNKPIEDWRELNRNE